MQWLADWWLDLYLVTCLPWVYFVRRYCGINTIFGATALALLWPFMLAAGFFISIDEYLYSEPTAPPLKPTKPEADEPVDLSVEQEFDGYVIAIIRDMSTRRNWEDDVRFTYHPAYMSILKMGRKAIPLLFRRLEVEVYPRWWFCALHTLLLEAPPVTPEYLDAYRSDKTRELADIWLAWAEKKGHYKRTESTPFHVS